ncbi:MAG: RluA family pseudouridine synthase [Lachnospiraceae bacterium]|nr:RluA family pseudouridine synthase [Lachnospiraceae bacterium]
MRKLTVNGKEEGQRLDKYLKRKLPQAPMSFFYKMLRKKNITLNGKKADGRETVQAGDLVTLFLADETIAKFRGETVSGRAREDQIRAVIDASDRIRGVTVLYEDDNVLVCTKPFGVLSQKAGPEDLSMNEWLAGHLLKKSKDPAALLDSFREYRPSVCNRLDRNTMGLIVCAVSLPGSRTMTELIRTRKLRKFYQMVVEGRLTGSGTIRGWLVKDPATNKVSFSDREIPGAVFSETKWKSLSANGARSLIEAELVTGRSHQLRVQFAHMGHPITGDPKYGNEDPSGKEQADRGKRAGSGKPFRGQLLCSCRLEFPPMEGDFAPLSGKVITCGLPPVFHRALARSV